MLHFATLSVREIFARPGWRILGAELRLIPGRERAVGVVLLTGGGEVGVVAGVRRAGLRRGLPGWRRIGVWLRLGFRR